MKMNNAMRIMVDMLSLDECSGVDSIEIGADTDRWYHIAWNPYMDGGRYEILLHEDTTNMWAFKTSSEVMEFINNY